MSVRFRVVAVGLPFEAFLGVAAVSITLSLSFCFLLDPRAGNTPQQHGWFLFLILGFI